MRIFGIKPYRRRTKKPRNKGQKRDFNDIYPNQLLTVYPAKPNHIWASDFTYTPFKDKFVYLATVTDLYTRKIVGFSILTAHRVDLVASALPQAVIITDTTPDILRSDQGREYASKPYIQLAELLNIRLSMSRKGCPRENGYQESFYSQFKVELSDPNRFDSLGKLVCEIYQLIHRYNNFRIHTALKTTPAQYAKQAVLNPSTALQSVS